MSSHAEFRCDVCAVAAPGALELLGPRLPKGWKRFDGKDFCGFLCVAEYAKHQSGAERIDRMLNKSSEQAGTE